MRSRTRLPSRLPAPSDTRRSASPSLPCSRKRSLAFHREAERLVGFGTYQWDLSTGHVTWSNGMHRLLGLPRGLLKPSMDRHLSLVSMEYRALFAGKLRRALRFGGDYAIEYGLVTPSGEPRWLLCRGRVILDAQGRATRLVGTTQDLTERRRVELAWRGSEQKYRTLVESLPAVVWEADPATFRLDYVNPRGPEVLGYPPEVWCEPTFFQDKLHPDDRDRVFQTCAAEVAAGRSHRLEYRLRAADGRWVWFHDETTVACENGRPVRLRGVLVDITDRKQVEALRAQKQRAEDASRMKSEFLANMSHEIRTPLTAILGFAEVLRSGRVGALAPSQAECLDDILTSGRHLLRLVNDVLDISKIEAGSLDVRPEPVRVSGIVDEVLNSLHATASGKRVEVKSNVHPDVEEVSVDAAKLRQLLYNYLSNAVKFTPAGGRVEVRASPQDGDRFLVEVEDNGIGVAPDDLGRLFVPFQQLLSGPSKKYGGSGLGLALTKRVVEAQGGHVGVRSTPGRGSVFFAILPRRVSAAPPPRGLALHLAGDPPAPVDPLAA